MRLRRVVVTGMGCVSPFGRGVDVLMNSIMEGKSAVRTVPELMEIGGLRSFVASLAPEIDHSEIPRRHRRTMSKMSIFTVLACRDALRAAGLDGQDAEPEIGASISSTTGSPYAIGHVFDELREHKGIDRIKSGFFFQIMNHSCASNAAQALGLKGRVAAASSACATGCQSIGYAYEMIAAGREDMMLCGGADEFHPLTVSTFDIINAASIGYNDSPQATPRPFDKDRDGVVCGEGAGVVLLEPLDSALDRGAEIMAEVVGFASKCDPSSIASPDSSAVERCMRSALADAELDPDQVGYVNAHATATEQGDIAESEAIMRIFGARVPVSSLKGHLGHTMAASGALESISTIEMLRRGCIAPTLNLEHVDPLCGSINHVRTPIDCAPRFAVKNSFALGGVNSSIIFGRYEGSD